MGGWGEGVYGNMKIIYLHICSPGPDKLWWDSTLMTVQIVFFLIFLW